MLRAILIMFLVLGSVTAVISCQPRPTPPAITVQDQDIGDSTIIIASVAIDKPGWLVVHPSAPDGKADVGTALALVSLNPGEYRSVKAVVNNTGGQRTVFAMLHYDSPADGKFTFTPGKSDDPPVQLQDGSVMKQFVIRGAPVQPLVEIKASDVKDNAVMISRLLIDKPGWLVLRPANSEGKPDVNTVIARQYLGAGDYHNLNVPLTNIVGEHTIFATLHYDSPADKEFTFAPGKADDPLVVANGNIVSASFTFRGTAITPIIEVSDQDIKSGGIVVSRVGIDTPGWLILHAATADGRPDTARDYARVFIGFPANYLDVKVALNVTGERTVFAMLHYDSPADGKYTFEAGKSDDPPVAVGGSTVMKSFKVRGAS